MWVYLIEKSDKMCSFKMAFYIWHAKNLGICSSGSLLFIEEWNNKKIHSRSQ